MPRGDVEEASWTADQNIGDRFPDSLTAYGPSYGKEVKDLLRHPGTRVGVSSAC